jgi:hypothetical protein
LELNEKEWMMGKAEIAWIAVRGLGIYFTLEAISYVPSLWISLKAVRNYNEIEFLRGSIQAELFQPWVEVGYTGFQFVFLLFLTYYCLRRGALIHRVLMYKCGGE